MLAVPPLQSAGPVRGSFEVIVLTKAGKSTYRIAGLDVQEGRILDSLEKEARTRGTDVSVDVILDVTTPFAVMFDITGMLGKIGFHNVNCYVMDANHRTMVEILRGKGNVPVPENSFIGSH